VDWVYTSCNSSNDTNLRVQPYRVPSLNTTQQGGRDAPSVLLIILESVSEKRFEVNMPLSDTLVQSFPGSVRFPHTSVMGYNTNPNVKEIAGSGEENIFQVARKAGVLTSIWDDYNPDHGMCEHYPFTEHRVCSRLLKNYGNEIGKLYYTKNPGCAHGEFWIHQHFRYIQKFWSVFPEERKFHVAKHYACHSEGHFTSVCNSNDAPLEAFLREFVPANNDTAVILMGDHGFHWRTKKGNFNEYIGGEFEHRHPLLHFLLPAVTFGDNPTTLQTNAERFVTHRDVHATLLGLLAGNGLDASTKKGTDLLRRVLPKERTCNEAGIPRAWCNCFTPRQEEGHRCHVDSKKGEKC
jgi:hypothetical protein